MDYKKVFKFFKEMLARINEHKVLATSAEMAYFLILSIFPLLALIISVASITFLSPERVSIIMETILNQETYEQVKGEVFRNISSTNKAPLISFTMAGTIFSASGGLFAIIRSLNRAYEIEETRSYFKISFLAIIETILLTGIMILALFVMVFGEVVQNFIISLYGSNYAFNQLWYFLRSLAVQGVIFICFSLIYFISPNLKLKYKEVIPGALLVTIGWSLLSSAFSIYVNNFGNFTKTYGSLGAGMLLLVWLYWNSTLILLGGELNAYLNEKKISVRHR